MRWQSLYRRIQNRFKDYDCSKNNGSAWLYDAGSGRRKVPYEQRADAWRTCNTFGGRAAEEVVFHSVTTGASNDIERATQIARAMVTQYGMSEKFGLMGLESIQNRYLDGRAVMNCSDATGALIDEEVKEMLKVAYDKAKKIIEDHREVMDEIAEFLIERETITGKEFMEIYNKSLKKDEPESVEEDKEKTELSEVETVSEESSLKDAESQDAQKVTEKKDSEEVKQEE